MKTYIITLIMSITALLACLCAISNASDKCQDPSKLSPKMKKAYYQLKKVEKEAGFKVSIKCNAVQAVKNVKK